MIDKIRLSNYLDSLIQEAEDAKQSCLRVAMEQGNPEIKAGARDLAVQEERVMHTLRDVKNWLLSQPEKPRTPEPGYVAEGTVYDLIPAFISELEHYAPEACEQVLSDYDDVVALMVDGDGLESSEDPDMPEILYELCGKLADALNEISPSFCYFGTDEGCGQYWGWWPNEEEIRDAIHDEEMLGLSFLPQHIYYVNDHGNATMFVVELKEVWSLV